MTTIGEVLLEQFDFSEVSHQLIALKESIFHAIASHEAKVAWLKQELLAGRYEIQSQHVAQKLLDENLMSSLDLLLS